MNAYQHHDGEYFGKWFLIFVFLIWFFTVGEPDMLDAIVKWLMTKEK